MKKFLTFGLGIGLIAVAIIPFSSAYYDAYYYYRYNNNNKSIYAYHAYQNGYIAFGNTANPRYEYKAIGKTNNGIVYQVPRNYRNSVSRPRMYTYNPYYYTQTTTIPMQTTRTILKPIRIIRINNRANQAYVRPLFMTTATTTAVNKPNITVINNNINTRTNAYEVKTSIPYSYVNSDGKKVITNVRVGDRVIFTIDNALMTRTWGSVRVDWDYQLERLNCKENGNQLSSLVTSEYPGTVNARLKVYDRDGITQYSYKADSFLISPQSTKNWNYRNIYTTNQYQNWYRYN